MVVTVADERMSKKARAARSFSSAWRKSNEPAADRKAYKTRGAHGWLDPDKDFPFHPRRRGEQTWPRTRAHDLIYTYVHIPKYYKRREKRNGGWTKRNVLASVEADSVPRQRQLGGGEGRAWRKRRYRRMGREIHPLGCKYPGIPEGIVFNYCLLSGRCCGLVALCPRRIVPPGGLRPAGEKGLILWRARASTRKNLSSSQYRFLTEPSRAILFASSRSRSARVLKKKRISENFRHEPLLPPRGCKGERKSGN